MNCEGKRHKIAFLTSADPSNKHSWSGTLYYMAKALEKHCGDVHFLGPVGINGERLNKIYSELGRLSQGKHYNCWHSFSLALEYAEIFERKLSGQSFDLIFAPISSTETAFLKTNIPLIYLSDATFSLMSNYYSQFSNLMDMSIQEGNIIEELAVKKAKLALYPSEWAAKSAIVDYGVDCSKVHVIPFGANLDFVPDREVVLAKRKSDKCRLLFIGVDWWRKGGDIAVETLLSLQKQGVEAELTICGCTPPTEVSRENITVIPFLDKNSERGAQELYNLYMNSDFFILPSRAECYGIVFSEAAAFGLPSITTDTGGISGAVKNYVNGFTLPFEATGADYANVIYSIYQNDDAYYGLICSSRAAFEQKLNWDVWGNAVKKLITEAL